MKDTKLTLLQYNVQKSQSVQELLLATSALQEVDIIALQEPWKNPHLETSTSTVFSSFLSLYCSEIGRTLFLINKNLKLSSLHPTFWNQLSVKLFPVPLRSRTITSDNHRTLSEVLETKRVSVGNHQNLRVKTHHFG